jgi:uncharacterized phage-associated protein
MQMYDGRKIANLLLSEFDPQRFGVSNLKLNKILFYVHGFRLVRQSRPLIKNHFEAWEHGPVVRVVYHEFKAFGSAPITTLARHLDYETGQHDVIRFDDIGSEIRVLITNVAKYYMQFSAAELRDMTHRPGGPWHEVYTSSLESRGIRDRIPNDLIQRYLADEFGPAGSVN